MPHDGHHHHHHDHPHDHHHGHAHTHDHAPRGHNGGAPPSHLHSHMHSDDRGEDLRTLAAAFIEGFRDADDKTSFLRLAGIPFSMDADGGPSLKLVEVRLTNDWQVGTASPGFASTELNYLPFDGKTVSERTNMQFVYVSLFQRRDVDLLDILRDRAEGDG